MSLIGGCCISYTLSNATLLTLSPPSVQRATITVEGDSIASVEHNNVHIPSESQKVDCSGRLVIPGNVCGHTHLYSTLARGMPGPLESPRNFIQILERVWWRLDRALDEETLRTSGLVGALDAVRSGTTTVIDHHSSPNTIEGSLDLLADAIGEVGLRAVLCYEVTDRGGRALRDAGLRENERFYLGNRRARVAGMVGAHASFTLEDSTLAEISQLADGLKTGVHIHVAEDAHDETDSLRRSGKRVVHRLHDAGVLDVRAIAAHAVHVDEIEADKLRKAGTWIAHNCRSNMNNSVGRSPVARLGTNLMLGTDGIDQDMFMESKTAFLRARESSLDAVAEHTISRLGAGAICAGTIFQKPMGRLEAGSAADLVVLSYDPPTPVTADNVSWHLIFGCSASQVESVMVGGRWVMRNREMCDIDEEKVRVESRVQARRLWDRMQEL